MLKPELTEEYRRGAEDEHRMTYEGMRPKSKELFDYVKAVAQRGDTPDEITEGVAFVFTAGWPLRRRLALAFDLAMGRYIRYRLQWPIKRK